MSARTQTVEGLRRKIDALNAKLAAQRDAWTREGVGAWEAHLAKKTSRPEIMHSVRKWARMLGPTYEALAAQRLVCVDEQADGTRLTDESALTIVARWADEAAKNRRAA